MQEYAGKKKKNYTQALREVECSLEGNTAKYIHSSHLSTSRFFVFFSLFQPASLRRIRYIKQVLMAASVIISSI